MSHIVKPSRIRDPKALERARALPCVACGARPPSDPHHVTSRGAGGHDEDANLMPLCRKHHGMIETKGVLRMVEIFPSVYHWLAKNGRIDVYEKAMERRNIV